MFLFGKVEKKESGVPGIVKNNDAHFVFILQ